MPSFLIAACTIRCLMPFEQIECNEDGEGDDEQQKVCERSWSGTNEELTLLWEEIIDQLAHWLRNSIDEGLESFGTTQSGQCKDDDNVWVVSPSIVHGDETNQKENAPVPSGHTAHHHAYVGEFVSEWLSHIDTDVPWIERISSCDEPPMYYLKDHHHNKIKGGFYEPEVQLVKYPLVYLVEKVIQHDKKNKKMLIKWLGFPDKNNSWEGENDFIVWELFIFLNILFSLRHSFI